MSAFRHLACLPLLAALGGCGVSLPGSIAKETAAATVCDAYTGPAASTLKAYEGLMHEHSSYSDGDVGDVPADYFRIAREAGYSFVGSSEHSDVLDTGVFISLNEDCVSPDAFVSCFLSPTTDKLFKWSSIGDQVAEASNADFLAIRGFEWTSDVFGHINVYFSRNFSNAKTDLGYALTMETFWSWFARDPALPGLGGSVTAPVPFGGGSDALAHFNHPGDKCSLEDIPLPLTQALCDWNDYELVPDAVERMFGIEAYNDGNREDRYFERIARALDKGWRLSFVGSEDEHFGEYAVEHRPKTVTLAQDLSEAAFREAWLARRTYALSPGIHARVEFEAAGHPMGSQLSCATGQTVPVSIKTTNADGSPFAGSLQVFGSGGELIAQQDGASGRFSLPVQDGTHWYFVRVHGADGQSAAYVAPVWITGR